MTVSVIMPARNAAETIEEALDSLLAQEWSDWRLVVIDDGSTDQTRAIAERYAATDPRIMVIDGPRRGAGAARNAGLAALREEWVLFFDADDTLLPAMLRRMMATLAEHPEADAVHCGWIYTDWHGHPVSRRRCEDGRPDLFPALARFCALTIHTCVFRRSLYDRAGPIDETLTTSEDFDLWQRIARLGAHFVALAEYLVTYRLREGQTWFQPERFLKDVLVVVGRGHAPDPRLPIEEVAPEHVNGMPAQGLFAAQVMMVVWAAGTLISRGQNPLPALDALSASGLPLFEHAHIAGALHDVVPMVASRSPAIWLERWSEFEPPLTRFLQALEGRTGAPELARNVTTIIESIIASNAASLLNEDRPVIALNATAALLIDTGKPLADLDLPGIERVICHVRAGGEDLGSVQLPVFDGRLASLVVKDAVAGRFAWPLLGKLFARQHYARPPGLGHASGRDTAPAGESTPGRIAGETAPSEDELHDRLGWDILLQELVGTPQEDARAARVRVAAGRPARVELSAPIPSFMQAKGPLEIDVTLCGSHVLALVLEPRWGVIEAARIRAAVRKLGGMELARAAVREGVLNFEGDEELPLGRRLRERAEAPASPQHGAAAVPARDAPLPEPMCTAMLRDVPSGEATIIGLPKGARPSELVRRAELPRDVAAGIIEALQPARFAHFLGGNAGADAANRFFVLPDLVSAQPAGQAEPAAAAPPALRADDIGPPAHGRRCCHRLSSTRAEPWSYTSPYERRRYEQMLSLLPPANRANVLEIGCGQGQFTVELAPLVEQLRATDVSDFALARTAQRCAAFANVSCARLDIVDGPLEGAYDAVFCSGLLHLVGEVASLRQVGSKIAGALAPGGIFITANDNAMATNPELGREAHIAGAKRIGQTLAAVPELDFEHELVTERYRIQRFRKRRAPRLLQRFAIRRNPHKRTHAGSVAPAPDFAASASRGPGKVPARTQEAATHRLPILMYHAVADHGPEPLARWRTTPAMFDAQMRTLRDAGFTSATFEDWHRARAHRMPLPGRRVIITFDDVYADFEQAALPILQRYGFEATLFVPTDSIGERAEWDAWSGTALPLLDLAGLKRARNAGMRFGAHGKGHRRLAGLAPREAVDELWGSRAALEQALEVEVDAFAYPFGSYDEISERLAAACSYRHAVTVNDDLSGLDERDLALSRAEARGGEDLEVFMRRMTV